MTEVTKNKIETRARWNNELSLVGNITNPRDRAAKIATLTLGIARITAQIEAGS